MLSIFLAHNYYRSANPSGENVAFEAEAELLVAKGHAVYKYIRSSDDIADFSPLERAAFGAGLVWSRRSYREIKRILAEVRPDIAHFHNTFPLISVSAFRACREAGVPVVHTLHNYRPLCLQGLLFRRGDVCEKCLGRVVPWPGVLHRCYQGSLTYSAAMALMQVSQRMAGTWRKDVDLFIAPSEFLRQKYVAAGFPADRITVKANFADVDRAALDRDRRYALFVGRLCAGKGLHTLLTAWKRLPEIPLIIAGDGPQARELRSAAEQLGNIAFAGIVSHSAVLEYLRDALYLVMPSVAYESFGMVVVEAFACGTPVVASRVGALPEIVTDGLNGLLFTPRDSDELASKAAYLWSHPEHARRLGREARLSYEARFTAERNYEQLLRAYQMALGFRRTAHGAVTRDGEPAALTSAVERRRV